MFRDEDVGRYLFHYTTMDAFLGHILPTGCLRMSPFSRVNDPRESQQWYCSIVVDQDGDGEPDVLAISAQFTAELKQSAKVLCLTRDDPNFGSARDGVFRRGFAHSRMWDRYAGGHTGVCLAYEIDSFGDAMARAVADRGELISRWISYDDSPPSDVEAFTLRTSAIQAHGLAGALRRHRDDHQVALYFFKSSDWASEFEFRWVLLSDHDDEYELVSVRQSLAGVIFGPDYPMESAEMVRSVLNDPTVVLSHLRYMNGRPIPVPVLPVAPEGR